MTAAVKFLEKSLEELTARVSAQETSRKWAEDNAKRLDTIEGQGRQQTNEAKEYARNKCLESDKQLRSDLDKTIPDMLAALENKMAERIKILENSTNIEAKMAERIKILEDAMKQHQAYIQNFYDTKPEDARFLTSCLKHLDEKVGKVKVAMVQGSKLSKTLPRS